jgi:hypothetical protein
MINQNWTTNIKLHENDINIWLSQFNKLSKNE